MILPYPPGVPLVMPGEMITEESRPVLEFLQMLCEIGAHYPGFESMMTKQAIDALEASDVIVGYTCLLYTSRCV